VDAGHHPLASTKCGVAEVFRTLEMPPMSFTPSERLTGCIVLLSAPQQGTYQPAKEISMKRVVIQYKVKPEHAEYNVELLRAVYEELERTRPDGLGHAVLRLADGVTFIHIAEETEEGGSGVFGLASFQRFEAGIRDRCEIPPAVQETSEVGSFRLFASTSPQAGTRP
jgi:hypothetical protein